MKYLELDIIYNKKILLTLFLFALLIRLAFCFYFQQFYFGKFVFQYKDTPSYLNPILNLIEYGKYQGDLFLEDSKYFRVPVYPTFLGFVHIIFGSGYFDYAVAVIQSIIDSISVVFVYLIILKISSSTYTAVISSTVYATYPFMILWVPISYTETVQIFLMWFLLFTMLHKPTYLSISLQGIVCGLLILTKQYLGIVLLAPLINLIVVKNNLRINLALLFLLLGVAMTLTPWVARNYLESGEIIVLKGESTGLRSVGKDFEAFYKFASLFNENVTPALYDVAHNGNMKFNKHPEFVELNQTEITEAIHLAYKCGPSFYQLREWVPLSQPPYAGCEEEVVFIFNNLTRKFWQQVNFFEAIDTRLDALKKIITKGDVVNKNLPISRAELIKSILFKYRVFILFLGFIGIFLLFRRKIFNMTLALFLTSMAMYGYFSLIIVHAEMRYLLVPDLLVSIFSGVTIYKVLSSFNLGKIAAS